MYYSHITYSLMNCSAIQLSNMVYRLVAMGMSTDRAVENVSRTYLSDRRSLFVVATHLYPELSNH